MRIHAILNYFGKCPDCGYPAEASAVERHLIDGTVCVEIVASCGLPCGWSGSAPLTTMTVR
ncbi:hypothetical protein [Nocardia lijiangensis]|uniref:hypothetical protein n=1 Tax=Nocardia lijiangensis TaxID=299618 RepID=UPI000830196C|nr:hypothetical protein [Nocardia lijiangensis]